MSGYNNYSSTFSYNDHSPADGQRPYDRSPYEYDNAQLNQQQPSYNFEPPQGVDDSVRRETRRNIKLLNEVINASVEPKEPKKSKKEKKQEDNDKYIRLFTEYVKEPIIMILLYVMFHTETVNDFLSSYLPSAYNNPLNIGKYYGVRGFVYVVAYYVLRNYRC